MRRYVARNSGGGVYQVMGTLNALYYLEKGKERVNQALFWIPLLYLLSPIFFMVLFVFAYMRYYKEIHIIFFPHKEVTAKYKSIFAPMTNRKIFSAVGYRVYPEELEEHLALIGSDDEEDIRKLIEKGKRMRRNMSRQFGFNIDSLTRHKVFIGTTGAGKTETLMSFFIDVLKSGSGIGMIDGKSDQAMEIKIYNLCKEYYYETQFYAIILNKPEKGTDSNTYSPLLSYDSALKASEFLGEFITGGEGNADYFANRGKLMLGNIVMHYKNRQKYYNEMFSLGDLSSAITPIEMNNAFYISYGVTKNIEKLIIDKYQESLSFARLIDRAKGVKTAKSEEFEHCEVLVEFMNQNSHLIKEVERALGIRYDFVSDYYGMYSLLEEYISGVSPSWIKYTKVVAEGLYHHFSAISSSGYLYTANNYVTMRDIRRSYEQFKNSESETYTGVFKYMVGESKEMDFVEAMSGEEENVEKINSDSMMQHGYAVQQWGRLFGLFKEYSRITGTPYPEVDGEDVIKNNKVLYVMLPVMELSGDQIDMLGKMFILMFKNIASIALGGEKQSSTPVQFKIFQNKIKPNPIFLVVYDELGSYMPNGIISLLASQLRSLRIALILSVQDTVSVQPEGSSGSREQSRILANLAKIILQNKDADTHEFEKMIPEIEVIESDGFIHSAVGKKVYGSQSLKVLKIKNFEIAHSTRFEKGFGVYIDGARDEPLYFQSYYIGDNGESALQIRKFDAFQNVYG